MGVLLFLLAVSFSATVCATTCNQSCADVCLDFAPADGLEACGLKCGCPGLGQPESKCDTQCSDLCITYAGADRMVDCFNKCGCFVKPKSVKPEILSAPETPKSKPSPTTDRRPDRHSPDWDGYVDTCDVQCAVGCYRWQHTNSRAKACLADCGCFGPEWWEDRTTNLLSTDMVVEESPVQEGFSTSSLVLTSLVGLFTGVAVTLFGGYIFVQKRNMQFKRNDVGSNYIKL